MPDAPPTTPTFEVPRGVFVPKCPACDYDLRGVNDGPCPECGTDFALTLLWRHELARQQNDTPAQFRAGAVWLLAILGNWMLLTLLRGQPQKILVGSAALLVVEALFARAPIRSVPWLRIVTLAAVSTHAVILAAALMTGDLLTSLEVAFAMSLVVSLALGPVTLVACARRVVGSALLAFLAVGIGLLGSAFVPYTWPNGQVLTPRTETALGAAMCGFAVVIGGLWKYRANTTRRHAAPGK